MNAGILAPGYAPPPMPSPLLGLPQPVPTPYGRRGDPFWDNVVLYLRMDGPQGSGAITDISNSGRRFSAFGAARIDGQIRFNSAFTGLFDGATSYWQESNSTLNLPADFTVEYFFYQTGANERYVVGKWGASGSLAWLTVHNTGSLGLGTGSNGNFAGTLTFTTPVPSRVWNHVAFTRTGSTVACFLNGRRVGTATSSANLTSANTNPLQIGQTVSAGFYAGNLAHIRVTRNVARYTTSFAPPTAPFPIGYQ